SDSTLGHFAASLRADAVVTRRQLLPPNPSVRPRVIFFGPHHDGLADVLADVLAAVAITATQASARTMIPPRLLCNIVCVLPFLSDERLRPERNDMSGWCEARRAARKRAARDRP